MDPVEQLLASEPGNIDALNLGGRIAYYQMQYRRARDYFEQAQVLDANNLETLTGLYDVETAAGDDAAAGRYLDITSQVAPGHIEVLSRQDPAQYSSEPRHQVSISYANSSFNLPGFPQWHERSLEYRHLGTDGNQQYIRTEHNHRFGTHDTMVEGGLTLNQRGTIPVEIAVAYTSNADFMPDYLARVGFRKVMWESSEKVGTTVLTTQVQHASYDNGDVNRLLAGIEYYLLDANAWLTPSIGMVRDQDGTESFAWTVGAHWQVNATTRFGVSYSDAPETENLITTGNKNYQAYIRQALSANLDLLFYYSRFERQNSYTRENLNLSLQYRF